MPKKCTMPETNIYLVIWQDSTGYRIQECVGARTAADVHRQLRGFYGNSVRLAKVVLDYGKEI